MMGMQIWGEPSFDYELFFNSPKGYWGCFSLMVSDSLLFSVQGSGLVTSQYIVECV